MRLAAYPTLVVLATGSGAAGAGPQGFDIAPQVSPSGCHLLNRRVYP